jgi:hypothetical protein
MSLTQEKNAPRAEVHVQPLLARFVELPAAEWRHAERLLRLETLATGEALTEAGTVADRFGFVIDGLVKKSHVNAGRSSGAGWPRRCSSSVRRAPTSS